MRTLITVHAIVVNDNNEILVLQRAKHRSAPGTWNCVTGYVQDRESAEEAALRELKEETNLNGDIKKTTAPFWVDIGDTRWVVISSLINVTGISSLKIDEGETQSYKWIRTDDAIVSESEGLKESLTQLGLI